MRSVELVEVAPRDGLQNERKMLPVGDRVRLVQRSVDAGLRRVEAVSFVHPKRVPQMAGAEDVLAALPRDSGASYAGLVLNERGLDRALAARVDEINVVVVATDELSMRNQGCTVGDGVVTWRRLADAARSADISRTVTVAAAFGCPFEGEVAPHTVLDLVRRVAEAEPDEIALADTIGVGTPDRVRTLLEGAREIADGVPLRCHFHNTRNTGYANAHTALDCGVQALDTSTGGFGGCPFAPAATGNIATEDLLYSLDRMGVETGVRLDQVVRTAGWLGGRLEQPVPALLGRAGGFPTRARPHQPDAHIPRVRRSSR